MVIRVGRSVKSADGSGSREIRPSPRLVAVAVTLGVFLVDMIGHDYRQCGFVVPRKRRREVGDVVGERGHYKL